MATRVSIANPTSTGQTEIKISGNSFVIEEAPADAAADRNLVIVGDPETGDTGGLPLISRMKYLGNGASSIFNRLFIRFVNGSSATVTIIIFDSRDEDVTLPNA